MGGKWLSLYTSIWPCDAIVSNRKGACYMGVYLSGLLFQGITDEDWVLDGAGLRRPEVPGNEAMSTQRGCFSCYVAALQLLLSLLYLLKLGNNVGYRPLDG